MCVSVRVCACVHFFPSSLMPTKVLISDHLSRTARQVSQVLLVASTCVSMPPCCRQEVAVICLLEGSGSLEEEHK